MQPFVILRWLFATLLLVAFTACSSTTVAPVTTSTVSPTNIPAATATTQPATPLVTDGIDISSLTGRIVFSAGPPHEEDIYVINADGSGLTQLTTNPATDFDPAWSPDGSKIAFRSQRDGNDEIYVMNADGSGQTILTDGPETGHSPEWSPDGKVVFPSSEESGPSLWVVNPDGSELRFVSEVDGEYPAWSPDGTQIAYDLPSASEFDIWVTNVDGSGDRLLAGGPTPQQGPAWSPDGMQIAFESGLEAPEHFKHIWIMNADGSGQRRLSQDYGARPVWSPDGRYILFHWGDLYVMRADGSSVTRLPISELGELTFPDWTQ